MASDANYHSHIGSGGLRGGEVVAIPAGGTAISLCASGSNSVVDGQSNSGNRAKLSLHFE